MLFTTYCNQIQYIEINLSYLQLVVGRYYTNLALMSPLTTGLTLKYLTPGIKNSAQLFHDVLKPELWFCLLVANVHDVVCCLKWQETMEKGVPRSPWKWVLYKAWKVKFAFLFSKFGPFAPKIRHGWLQLVFRTDIFATCSLTSSVYMSIQWLA